MNRYDFEQNGEIENWNGNLKKKNCNKPRNISDFLIETEKWRNENLKKKMATSREIFAIFIIISELSNGTEILKRKIATNRERFLILSKMAKLSNKAEKLKKKSCNKPTNIPDF